MDAVLGQEFGAALEEGVVEAGADMFEHPDRGDAVEPSVDVAIILEQEFGRSGQPLFGGSRIGDLQLLGRQRDASDVAARNLGEIEAEAAPARADIEHTVAGSDEELCGDVALLGELCVVKRGHRRLEIGAAILLVGVEEERIEPAVEVVVVRNISAGARARIELLQVPRQIAKVPPGLCPLRQ
ncbi:hypothetical protein ACVWXO_007558 [Bradyrhizobium sp. LM2.7]